VKPVILLLVVTSLVLLALAFALGVFSPETVLIDVPR
jgi:hypothetical protein